MKPPIQLIPLNVLRNWYSMLQVYEADFIKIPKSHIKKELKRRGKKL